MRTIQITDTTMQRETSLSFREKIELSKLLDRLGVDAIETAPIANRTEDGLLLKSLSSAVQNACLAVPVPSEEGGAAFVFSCLQEAKRVRLQVVLPISTVQMEYLCHKKPDAMLELIGQQIAACKALCNDVEFVAEDASRSEPAFLQAAMDRAVNAGASAVTFCDTAGDALPEELEAAIRSLRAALPEGVRLGVRISNALYLANACAVAAIRAGADEVKLTACGEHSVSLQRLATLLKTRGDDLNVRCGVRTTELARTVAQIEWLCKTNRSKASPFELGVREDADFTLNVHDDRAALEAAAKQLGYDLSEDDLVRVYDAFQRVASRKDGVSAKELDALIASAALQVPPTYKLDSYVINAGNRMGATSHIRLLKNGVCQEGICIGDGPIDAAFLAIEQITGTHYELDDFQIRAVTEGREAMGETVVRLRSGGKLYAGRGISTDIVGSSIYAYLAALNKIVYEEENAQ